jgi:MFS transporter, FSR family, fosmidomycin resistance protein
MQTVTKAQSMTVAPVLNVLFAVSIVHFLNDSMQAAIPAVFPILEHSMHLSFTQVGWIAFTLSMTSSIMQPVVGFFTDKKPSPYLLPLGMFASLLGLLGLAFAPNYAFVLLTVIFIGLGSAVFHPEGSRVTHLAAGSRKGFAQSLYQVGGNSGASLAPIMTVLIFVPFGQFGAVWLTSLALLAIVVSLYVSAWYKQRLQHLQNRKKPTQTVAVSAEMQRKVRIALLLVVFLVFARSWVSAGISNYYQFYLMKDYGMTVQHAQIALFVYMAAGVLGTFFGGPLADRFGKRNMILFSLLGSAPFALLLPHVSPVWVYPILVALGFVLSSSFSVTVVYAQELIPGKVGMASGLIIGLAFGMGAVGAVALGKLADLYGLYTTMVFCSLLPLLGVLTWLLPNDQTLREWRAGE